jgi:serine/threonine protein kinase
MPLQDGVVFAGYTVIRSLGAGNMGEVYLVQHPRLPRAEALKILPAAMSTNREFRERFSREADVVATMYHPHIVGIHDRGESNGQLWISMDYIDGTDAARLLRERHPGGLPPREVANIVSAVADALDYAHDHGLLHRDVKPANVLLTAPGTARQRVLLADFGIARWIAETSGLTQTNMAVGTVLYAAPEQLTDQPVDGRTDQYALAATAYHLLTGSPPFAGSNPVVVIGQQLNEAPPSLATRSPALSRLDPIISTALAKKANDRFARCGDFAAALAAQIAAGDTAPASMAATMAANAASKPATTAALQTAPPSTDPPVSVPAARAAATQWPLVVAVIAVALIIAVVVLAFRPWQQAQTATTPTPPTISPPTSLPNTSATGAITFDNMKDFITGYYSELPAHASDAWNKLDVGYQQRTGLDDYLKFWSTVRSVTVLSVGPRDSSSVVARTQYVGSDGHTLTEDRWFRFVTADDALRIGDSEVETTIATMPPTEAAPPSTATSPPGPSVYDQNFVSLMAQEGWGCTDNSDDQKCRNEMVGFAHEACSYSGQSFSFLYQTMQVPEFFGARETRRAIAIASQAYPNCNFTGPTE